MLLLQQISSIRGHPHPALKTAWRVVSGCMLSRWRGSPKTKIPASQLKKGKTLSRRGRTCSLLQWCCSAPVHAHVHLSAVCDFVCMLCLR